MQVIIEPVYLIKIDGQEIMNRIREKILQKELLTDEALMELIILPLTAKGTAAKRELLKEAVELAKALMDENQRVYALAGLLTFSDKFIDKEFAKYVREDIRMLKVEQLIYDEGVEAGEKIGERRGTKKGEDRFALLTQKLLDDLRIEELFEATNNSDLREVLYKEYGIKAKK